MPPPPVPACAGVLRSLRHRDSPADLGLVRGAKFGDYRPRLSGRIDHEGGRPLGETIGYSNNPAPHNEVA